MARQTTRVRLVEPPPAEPPPAAGMYFTSTKEHLKFISTGSTLLDCALGGGLVAGRIANFVGDKSSSKTGLVIECMANCNAQYPRSKLFYREAESAFDKQFAEAMGMPKNVKYWDEDKPLDTVEAFYKDLVTILKTHKGIGLYALDSLDALSDDAEMRSDMKKPDPETGEVRGSYGTAKAKKMSELFRKLVREIEANDMAVIIVSQIRDKIGAMFGKKTTRSGGRALDFYATHIVELAHIKTLMKIRGGVQRAVGIKVRAKVEKNKVALPKRECEFDILFGYGIDDLRSCVDWLDSVDRLDALEPGMNKAKADKIIEDAVKQGQPGYGEITKDVSLITKDVWREIEGRFLPKFSKYGTPT